MTRVATLVPAESDLLCEGCGYTLNGLPGGGNCPECGKPIEQSLGDQRSYAEYEEHQSPGAYFRTFLAIIVRPRQFFSSLLTRPSTTAAQTFAEINLAIASTLFAISATGHFRWVLETPMISSSRMELGWVTFGFLIVSLILVFFLLLGLKTLATWLSAIEAHYWGMRLPHAVVRRGMHFHSAQFLPVGLVAVCVVWGYRLLLHTRVLSHRSDNIYLYTLCLAVIVSALYLFWTYWIAMKSMMYANR